MSPFCNHTPSLKATDFLAQCTNNLDWEKIQYRGGGWPGYMTFIDSKGSHSYPFRKTWASGFGIWFKNRRCELCNDPFSKNADMAVGDAYFLQESDTNGTTFCITRNNRLNEILKKIKNCY